MILLKKQYSRVIGLYLEYCRFTIRHIMSTVCQLYRDGSRGWPGVTMAIPNGGLASPLSTRGRHSATQRVGAT